jgi:23S rRNA (uracil1939-C5)-methyltransferase
MQGTLTLTIEKLVFGGQGIAHLESGLPVFVWNALPGETVIATIRKKKRTYYEAVATEILTPSPDRIAPIVPHYLSTSPWQIMTSAREQQEKISAVLETYDRIGGWQPPTTLPIVDDLDQAFGYRNKIEFSFCDKNFVQPKKRPKDFVPLPEDISFSFFERATHNRIPVETSVLASPAIMETAQQMLAWIKTIGIPNRTLKSLIIRSNLAGETITTLFLKDEIELPDLPKLPAHCKGCYVYFSSHKTPASRPEKLMKHTGEEWLTESILGSTLTYGMHSFFQVNIPIFEATLRDMQAFLPEGKPVLDLYSGVGSIGIPLASHHPSVTMVDCNKEAIAFAQKNIQANNLASAQAICAPAEQVTEMITSNHIVILDPPRAGLHEAVTQRLLEVLPETILYLSCNISTQARDIGALKGSYDMVFASLYNYFPRTPHVEGLCVLKKKNN